MTWSVSASGTNTLSPNVETVLVSGDTTNATYQAYVDASALANPGSSPAGLDVVILRAYTMTLASGTLRQVWSGAFMYGANQEKTHPPVPSDQSYKFTLQQIQATYSVSAIAGTVPDGSTVTASPSGATGIVRVAGGGNVAATNVTLLNTNATAFASGDVCTLTGGNTFTLSSGGTGASVPWKVLRI